MENSSQNKGIRVLLADDHPVVRLGIRNLLDKAPDITIAGEADDGLEALHLVKTLQPDVLVLDIELPILTGIEVARHLQNSKMPTRILVLSGHAEEHYIRELFAIGVSGYLVKEEAPVAIVEAVRGVARGEQGWYSKTVVHQIAASFKAGHAEPRGLTPRQKQVLRLVAKGKTNQEVGRLLGVSEKTVERHMYSITTRLGVMSRVEAAVIGIREGWL